MNQIFVVLVTLCFIGCSVATYSKYGRGYLGYNDHYPYGMHGHHYYNDDVYGFGNGRFGGGFGDGFGNYGNGLNDGWGNGWGDSFGHYPKSHYGGHYYSRGLGRYGGGFQNYYPSRYDRDFGFGGYYPSHGYNSGYFPTSGGFSGLSSRFGYYPKKSGSY